VSPAASRRPDGQDPAAAVFAALGDTVRRELLRTLAVDGPASATLLADGRGITRQAVAKHLSVLGRAGLVSPERHGREVRYRAHSEALVSATEWIEQTGAAWDRRLARLADVVDPPSA
jgi:DNA-binding transcriptional ArsR family regulator